jgi:hypothetical protein
MEYKEAIYYDGQIEMADSFAHKSNGEGTGCLYMFG